MSEATNQTATPESPAAVETAIEQATADLHADATKAVEEAIRAAETAAPKEPAKGDDAGEPEPDEPAAKAEAKTEEKKEDPPAKKGIGDILSAREAKAEPKTEAQKLLDEAKQQQAELAKLKDEIARDREEVARDKAKLAKLKDLKHAPEALKELGWDPEDFVASAARANTPEGKLEALVRAQAEELAALKGKAEAWEKQAEDDKASAKKQAEDAAVRKTEEGFLEKALNAEAFPTLAMLYGDDDEDKQVLVLKAHSVARRYRAATGGEEATFEQIAEYLEDRAKAKLGPKDAKEEKASKDGKAQPGGRPTGKRTLNGSDASVRTSTPVASSKTTDDLDDLARRARQAAERAIRESGA